MIFNITLKKKYYKILIKLISNDINFNCISDYIIFIIYILKIKILKRIFDQIILINDINKLNSLKKYVKIKCKYKI